MKSNEFSSLDGSGMRIAVIGSRFHQALTDAMVVDACAGLESVGVASSDITVVRVPGSFELPVAAAHAAASERFDAVVCLGVVVKGETRHDFYIAQAVANGLMDVSTRFSIPVTFGVLTVDTLEQAIARAEGKQKKGWEAALSAVETVCALRVLS